MNYGLVRAAGHMDFYPNGGDNLQPGCVTYYEKGTNTLQTMGCMIGLLILHITIVEIEDQLGQLNGDESEYFSPSSCNLLKL